MQFRSHRGGSYYTPESTMPGFRSVKRYAVKFGIANANNPYDVREALLYAPDLIEV